MTDRPTAENELVIDGDPGAATQPDVPLTIELEPHVEPGPAGDTAPAAHSDEQQVARFVAESEPLGSGGQALSDLDEDSPTIARHTMRLLDPDVEDLDAESTVRARSAPPPPPPAAGPPGRPEPPLSNVVLGPGLSTRGEITERMNLIPSTHPMANSLAPGGSPLSTAPAARRPSLRWQVVLGALALVGLGAGASQYLQSWGEQHAAGFREGEQTSEAPVVSARPAAAPARELDEEPAVMVAADPASAALPQGVPEPPPIARPEVATADGPAAEPGAETASSAADREPMRASAPVAPRPRKTAAPATKAPGAIRLAVGDAAIRPAEGPPFRPTLGVVNAAIDGVRGQVQACVGDAHGVTDVVLTVRSTGVISHALVQGAFAGSSAGSCIARTLRGARVAPFRKPVVRILYPLQL